MKTLNRSHILIMAITAGVCVANVYYSQPILNEIGQSFGISGSSAGIFAVLSQVGYGIGLFFLTPIGDMIERRKLILRLQLLLILSLLFITFSRQLWMIYVGSFLVGTFAVIAQVILPMAASLTDKDRGKIVGQIFTGVLIGILVARVFSGTITNLLGWRYVYGISAVMVTITTVLMQTDFPKVAERFEGSYGELLHSTLIQFKRFRVLRRTTLTGALAFGTLSSFWVVLTFHLSAPPFGYNSVAIGMFGLLAAAGALAAPLFGKLSDTGSTVRSLIFSTSLTLAGIICIRLFPESLTAIWIAVIFLDVGVQATQVTNIAIIYKLDQTANSRINTIYMTGYFIGGATGAYLSILCWEQGGWAWSTTLMISLAILAIINVRPFSRL